uniref:Uncharacterized protein n=1 Tax=viral metagenome TaxID=1070528 RepID=A0A6H1ZJQ8_9ZZZZ
MKAETVIFAVLIVSIALTLSACTPQEVIEVDYLQADDVFVAYTTPQHEPPQMVNTKTEIINPYFSLQNSTSEIFRVDHAGNFYLYPLLNCDTLDTDGAGLLSCGTDADTTYTNASFDISQLANTGNVDLNAKNLTVSNIIMEVDQADHWIYDNSSCIIIKAGTTYLEVCE